MKIGEVRLLTNDVVRLANFYKQLLEYRKVLDLGAEVIEGPTVRPWGAVNMSFYDPDRNIIYFRQL